MPVKERLVPILLLSMCLAVVGANGQEAMDRQAAIKKATAALRSQDFAETIKICLEKLATAPEDYDFNFLLARAYSYSGDWPNAEHAMDRLLALQPDNTDLLVFGARLRFWMNDYASARKGYGRVLDLKPGHIEALLGMADLAAAEEGWPQALAIYRQIIELHPEAGEGYFGCGRAYQALGDYQKAMEYFEKAVSHDAANADYRNMLNAASARLPKRYELRFQYMIEGFSDAREDYLSQQLVFQFQLPRGTGPLLLKSNHTRRFGRGDTQFGLEFYPKLWSKAYGYFDFGYSFENVHYPRSSYHFEVYQGLLTSAELSLGFRRMNFPAESVSLLMGSLAHYFGNYYAVLRWYYQPGQNEALSWYAQVRRYFSDHNFAYLGYGRGARPFDIVTAQDLLIHDSWILLSGLVWYAWDKIRLELHFSRIEDASGLRRDTFFATTGFRW